MKEYRMVKAIIYSIVSLTNDLNIYLNHIQYNANYSL